MWGCGQGVLRLYLQKPLLFQHLHPLEPKSCKILHAFEPSPRSGWILYLRSKPFPLVTSACEILFFKINSWREILLTGLVILLLNSLRLFIVPSTCMCLPTHSNAQHCEKGKSTFAARWGRPVWNDETAAARVQCWHLPLPAPRLVGSATPLILPVKPLVV